MFGSLLCFSNDKFASAQYGTVAEYDPKAFSKGLIKICPESHVDNINAAWRRKVFLAVESPAFFEASRHILTALQDSALERFPLCKYLVFTERGVHVPGYLKAARGTPAGVYNLDHLRKGGRGQEVKKLTGDPCDENNWPPGGDLGMDDAQYSAFKAALSRELFVGQGESMHIPHYIMEKM
jgi:hypothetical protein